MGMYLDSKNAYALYKKETGKPYFIDKSRMLKELIVLAGEGEDAVCITRPRRFGKTVAANMTAAFFSRAADASALFHNKNIAKEQEYVQYLNQYPVIHIPFNDVMRPCRNYEDYISRIEHQLVQDLKTAWPDAVSNHEESAVAALLNIYAADDTVFVFVLDEFRPV